MERSDRIHVYVWKWPVRLFHWVNLVCILVLGFTGYLIGNPVTIQSASEASFQYWFGTVRFLHFTFAYIWVCIALTRIYWGFVGNEFVRFKNFLPLRKPQWEEINAVLRMDILQVWKGATFSTGHNTLSGLAYTIGFVAFLFQAVTGFGLYIAMSENWFAPLFAWVIPLFGGDHSVRLWHHLTLWFFLAFMLIHVYLAAYHDYIEATGTISSMVGGWKFVRRKKVLLWDGGFGCSLPQHWFLPVLRARGESLQASSSRSSAAFKNTCSINIAFALLVTIPTRPSLNWCSHQKRLTTS